MTPGESSDEAGFVALTAKITRERQFACGSYKDKCLRRRIAVRMRACRAASYGAYARHLDAHPEEWDKLLDALTINVTKFFRNPDVYDAIAKSVVPVLWNSRAPIIRVWSAGCATGEEPYSLAILFHQHALASGSADRAARVRILGSDIDRRSLATAAAGSYAEHAFAETRVGIRERYFSRGIPSVVAPEVRALVQFERRDLLNEPAPDGPFHLVVCRNVMIYLDRPTQERLVARFHEILAPGGFLVLGKTEALFGALRDRFTVIEQRARLYRRA